MKNQISRCRCGVYLPEVKDTETPYEFCSSTCSLKYSRTFRIDRLYHKFLKPETIPLEALNSLAYLLEARGFIKTSLDKNRYAETPKLADKTHKKELFTLIAQLKNKYSNN